MGSRVGIRKSPSWLKNSLTMPSLLLMFLSESPAWMLNSDVFKVN